MGDRTGGKSDRTRLSDEDTGKLQVRYTNFSKNKSVGTLVPTSHLSALQNAFENLRKRVGKLPKDWTKLHKTVSAVLQNPPAPTVDTLLAQLRERGLVHEDAGTLRYTLGSD